MGLLGLEWKARSTPDSLIYYEIAMPIWNPVTSSKICPTRAQTGAILEHRDGIYRRCGAAHHDQGRHNELELIAPQRLGALRQRVEVHVVDQMHAHHHDRANVNRHPFLVVAKRHRVANAIGTKHGDLTIVQPWQAGGVEPRQPFLQRPCSLGLAALAAPGAHQQHVALLRPPPRRAPRRPLPPPPPPPPAPRAAYPPPPTPPLTSTSPSSLSTSPN